MTHKPYLAAGIGMALVIFLADQFSKYWVLEILDLPSLRQMEVLPFFALTMVWNRGVTFGLFAADGEVGRLILVGIASAAVIAFGFWLWRAQTWLVALSVGAIAGGAIGNVIDRIRFGAVADFLHFHAWGWSWYVFNVADMAVVCGVAALIADGFLRSGEKSA